MEQNSSNVCVATVHNDDVKSSRLSSDDAMPLYATIIPSNTRKARWVLCFTDFFSQSQILHVSLSLFCVFKDEMTLFQLYFCVSKHCFRQRQASQLLTEKYPNCLRTKQKVTILPLLICTPSSRWFQMNKINFYVAGKSRWFSVWKLQESVIKKQ